MTRRLPGQVPVCGSCGLDRPAVNGRCDLCSATFGPASAPELVRDILPRVLGDLPRQAS